MLLENIEIINFCGVIGELLCLLPFLSPVAHSTAENEKLSRKAKSLLKIKT